MGDSANDGQKRMNRINPSIEADAKTEAKVMLVASMAAAAAKKRSNKPGGDASDREKEVATLFNSVTVSKSESAEEKPERDGPSTDKAGEEPPRIAASVEPEERKPSAEPLSIGALAAAAALKKKSAAGSAPEEKKSEADAKTEAKAPKAEATYSRMKDWYNEPQNAALRSTWGAFPAPEEFQTWPGFVAVTNAFLDASPSNP